MLITTFFLFCLSMASEQEIYTQNLSVSILAVEAGDETVQVELNVTGQQPQAVMMHDPTNNMKFYVAATTRVGEHMNQAAGLKSALQYEEVSSDHLEGSLSILLPKVDFSDTLEIAISDIKGQAYTVNLGGLLDHLGKSKVFTLGASTELGFSGSFLKKPACCPSFYRGMSYFRADCELNYFVCAYRSPFGFAEYLCAPGTCSQ